MECAIHPENEAIGTCASCGRRVCSECKELHDDIIHCKQCVDQGKIIDKPSLDWQAYFYYLPSPGSKGIAAASISAVTTPYPIADPETRSFRIGRYGALIGGLITLLVGLGMPFWTDGSMATFFNVLLVVMTLPYLVGLYGFHRNYGAKMAMGASWGLTIFFILFLVLNIYDFIQTCNLKGIECEGVSLTFKIGYPLIGLGYLLSGIAFLRIKDYFPTGSGLRNLFLWTSLGTSIGSVLMLIPIIPSGILPYTIFLLPIGVILIAIFMFLMSFIFKLAPLPERMVDSISDDSTLPKSTTIH